jgi:hypothetical protein
MMTRELIYVYLVRRYTIISEALERNLSRVPDEATARMQAGYGKISR